MQVRIAPSILSADAARLGEEVAALEAAGADLIHVDVMDGHFVPNLTIGPGVLGALRRHTTLPLDVHLMIEPVDPYLEAFVAAGADVVTVHAEACPHLDRTLSAIHDLGARAGVALNPATHESALAYLLDHLDLVLVMSVNPGFGGQRFIPTVIEKIRRVRDLLADRPIDIEVDGGITAENARSVVAAGASVLVAGSAIFGGPYEERISAIRFSGSSDFSGV